MRILLFTVIIMILPVSVTLSQDLGGRNGRPMKKSEVIKQMDLGVELMDQENYQAADEKFRFVLSRLEALPANLAFYIGKNSYFLKEYKQSIDWLNKYLALKGTKGMYYFEASDLLKKSEKAIVEASGAQFSDSPGTDTLFTHNYINCGENAKVVCPVCKGRTVIIQKGKLNDIYKPCPYSDEKGYLTCEDYNLLIQGKLKPRTNNQ